MLGLCATDVNAAIERMNPIMIDANHISERLASMRQEMNDPRTAKAHGSVNRELFLTLGRSANSTREASSFSKVWIERPDKREGTSAAGLNLSEDTLEGARVAATE
jgi:hypothetical protein